MIKPRLRIPHRAGLSRLALASRPQSSYPSSPFAVAAAAAQQRSIHATPVRCKHEVAPLNDLERFSTEGVPGLYSGPGFDAAYNKYQRWCLDELNRLTDGTKYESIPVRDLSIITSREPQLASIFNHASMAHNNHFFFESLSSSGQQDPSDHMPKTLKADLEASFGSLETLQREMILTANAMFGPGFVWLVRSLDSNPGSPQRFPYRVLTTYLAGSPYPAAHWRKQGTDMNSQGGLTDRAGETIRHYYDMQNLANGRPALHGSSAGGDSSSSPSSSSSLAAAAAAAAAAASGPRGSILAREASKNPGGANLIPVLCVNTWEFAWLFDWGVGNKFSYLAAWWNAVNWAKVDERASLVGDKQMSAEPVMPQAEAA